MTSIIPFEGLLPTIDPSAFNAPTAAVIGVVENAKRFVSGSKLAGMKNILSKYRHARDHQPD